MTRPRRLTEATQSRRSREEGEVNSDEEERSDGGNDEEMEDESTSPEPQVSQMPPKPDAVGRNKRPSESDPQDDPKLPKMDTPKVKASTSETTTKEVTKPKMTKADLKLSRNQEGFLKVKSFLSQDQIDLLIMSYGELNSNLKVQYDEMMRLQELIKGNKVTEEEKGAVDEDQGPKQQMCRCSKCTR